MNSLCVKFDEIRFGWVLSYCTKTTRLLTPDCGLDLERRNLTCVHDISSPYALSFCAVSLNELH